MKNNILTATLLVIALIATSLTACAKKNKHTDASQPTKQLCAEWLMPDSAARANLGDRLTSILMNANKVNVYSVKASDSITDDDIIVEQPYIRGTLLGKLNKGQIAILQFIFLANGHNYSYSDTRPMTPHYPQIEYEFIYKKEKAQVWMSPNDMTWGIRYDGRNLFTFDNAVTKTTNRLNHLFIPSIKTK